MHAWVPAVSGGGWNTFEIQTQTPPISHAVVDSFRNHSAAWDGTPCSM